jgi:putative transposase
VGKKTSENPTDRGKSGVKRSVQTDGRGVPIGVAIAGASAHDQRLFRQTIRSIPLRCKKRGERQRKPRLYLDKGYFGKPVEQFARQNGYVPHVPPRGQTQTKPRKKSPARRWVVEGCHSWTNRARRLLVRWEKKADNYLAFIHLQFAHIALKQARVLG